MPIFTQLTGLLMFAKLFFVRDTQSMMKIVIAGLYPEHYLEAPDVKGSDGKNRDRLEKVCSRDVLAVKSSSDADELG